MFFNAIQYGYIDITQVSSGIFPYGKAAPQLATLPCTCDDCYVFSFNDPKTRKLGKILFLKSGLYKRYLVEKK
jgi:hypothetical protein